MNAKKQYRVCSRCSGSTAKDNFRCHECGHWELDTSKESEKAGLLSEYRQNKAKNNQKPVPRIETGQWDLALGGGLVRGNTILICGQAGGGKSTLLSQICGKFPDQPPYYVAAEESRDAIDLRFARLGIKTDLYVYPFLELGGGDFESDFERVKPKLVITDSLQKAFPKNDEAQLFHCMRLKRYCVQNNACGIVVSHVNKDTVASGAYTIQHEVDVVLCLFMNEDKTCELYSIKSRQRPTFDIIPFAMTDKGLKYIEPKKEKGKSR